MSRDILSLDMTLDGQASRYLLGDTALNELATVAPNAAAVVMDQTVADLCPDLVARLWPGGAPHCLVLPGGEAVKSLARLEEIYGALARANVPRDGTLVGVGGGTILDLTGLAAATWKRGIGFVAVPTTLLAMVDAAIGGKTALNTAGLKNPVGVFHPARAILAAPSFLATLPRAAWRDGLAEMIKTALIGDPALFARLHDQRDRLRDLLADGAPSAAVPGILDALPWAEWTGRAAAVKADVVNRDFRELGPRRALNLGHTLGHALEAHSHQQQQQQQQQQQHPLSHGAAVAIGMAVVYQIATARGTCPAPVTAQVLALLAACDLPTTAVCPPVPALETLLAGDKKAATGHGARWVLPQGIGAMDLDGTVTVAEIREWLG